jgi:hypothetical protein
MGVRAAAAKSLHFNFGPIFRRGIGKKFVGYYVVFLD